MTIVLETPAQIGMWVLLSRRGQLKLQLKGLKTAGLIKWCRENIEGCESARTARDCIVPLEFVISEAGGPADYSIVNIHVMEKTANGNFRDRGIYPDMASVEANAGNAALYLAGRLEVVLTLDDAREATGDLYMPA